MINHSCRSVPYSISTRFNTAAAVALLCRVGRPEAWRYSSAGSNPASASSAFHAGPRSAINLSPVLQLAAAGVIFYFNVPLLPGSRLVPGFFLPSFWLNAWWLTMAISSRRLYGV